MRIHRSIFTASAIFTVLAVGWLSFNKVIAAQPCVVKPVDNSWAVQGQTITGYFKVEGDAGCTQPVSVMTWNADSTLYPKPEFWTTQTVHKIATEYFGVGTHSLSVQLPVCSNNPNNIRSYQADIIASANPSHTLSPPGTGSFYDQLQANGWGIVVSATIGDGTCPGTQQTSTPTEFTAKAEASATFKARASASCPSGQIGNPAFIEVTETATVKAKATSTVSKADAETKAKGLARQRAEADAKSKAEAQAAAKARETVKCENPQITVVSASPTKPPTLPNTGPARNLAIFAAVSIAGGLIHYFRFGRNHHLQFVPDSVAPSVDYHQPHFPAATVHHRSHHDQVRHEQHVQHPEYHKHVHPESHHEQ